MYKVSEAMLQYIEENNINKSYLVKIGIPLHVVYELPIKDEKGFEIKISLLNYLDELEEEMINYIWQELFYKENFKNIDELKLAILIRKFDLKVCPFWLEFCNLAKIKFAEQIYT